MSDTEKPKPEKPGDMPAPYPVRGLIAIHAALAGLSILATVASLVVPASAWSHAFLGNTRMLPVALLAAPLLWNLAHADEHPMLVVDGDGAAVRSEPRSDAKRIGALETGSEVAYLDHLPGWIKVADGEGREVWVRAAALFDLVR